MAMFAMTPRKREKVALEMTPFERLRDEFAALYERFFGRWPMPFEEPGEYFWATEVDDLEKEVLVRMEAPGFEADDFDVNISGNVLIVKAERKEEIEEKEKEKEYTEKRVRHFERRVTLPAPIVPENATARYHAGVLEIRLPKTEEAKPHRVAVKG
jgi:HSP20 family protein